MNGIRLYKRRVRVTIGQAGQAGFSWTDLRVAAKVTKNDNREPNTAEITLYNLSKASRGQLGLDAKTLGHGGPVIRVELSAGYDADGAVEQTIFRGVLDKAAPERRDGVDTLSVIEASDGGKVYREARGVLSLKGPLTAADVIGQIASRMGLVPPTVLPEQARAAMYLRGYVFSGPLRDALTAVCGLATCKWSLQDGALVITAVGEPTLEPVVVLSAQSGLLGTPEREDGGAKVRFRCLLNGGITPRRRVQLVWPGTTGMVMVKSVTHSLDTHGADFFTDGEGVFL